MAKCVGEAGWRGEAQRIRDRLDALVRGEQLLRVFEAASCHVLADRAALALAEAAGQLPHRHLAQRRELGERGSLANLVEPLVDESQAPRCEAAGARRLRDLCAIAPQFDRELCGN